MILFDYVLLAILAYFALWGFRKGLIRAVGAIVGLVLSTVIASRYFEEVALFIAPFLGISDNFNLARIIAFVGLLFVVSILIKWAFVIVEKMYKVVAVLPGMKLGNRLLGAALGLMEGAIILGLIIYFASRFPFGGLIESFLAGSKVAPLVLSISAIVQPFLPEAIRQIQGLI